MTVSPAQSSLQGRLSTNLFPQGFPQAFEATSEVESWNDLPRSWACKWNWDLNPTESDSATFPIGWLCKSWAKAEQVKELVASGLRAGRASVGRGWGGEKALEPDLESRAET